MRQLDINKTAKSVVLFCRLVKLGHPCTAKSMCNSARNARLLKTVLTHKFTKESGAPYDFPRLFICDDKRGQLFHKCTTPNGIDLGDLSTISVIQSLMTYIAREEREKISSDKLNKMTNTQKQLSIKYDIETIAKIEVANGFVHIFFR